jgi:hypothetical protein
MQRAPAVRFPARRPCTLGWWLGLIWVFGAVACAWWCFQSTGWTWRHSVGAAAVLLGGMLAAASWRQLFTGELHWDGLQWWANSGAGVLAGQDPCAVHPRICLDAFNLFLLRLDALEGGRSHWCGLRRADDPSAWGDLRRALYSSGAAFGNPPAAPDTGMGAN